MSSIQIAHLFVALCFTVAGIVMLRSGSSERRNAKLSGILFLIAAAINWALFLSRF